MTTRQILIVEGERSVAESLSTQLRALGFEVAGVVRTGRAACGFVAASPPQLVMMSVQLDGHMSGLAAGRAIREHSHVPIIYMCDVADVETVRLLEQTQPFRFLEKPVTEEELGAHLRAAFLDKASTRPERELEEGFFAISLDLLCCLDFNGYFDRLNPAWERTLGFTRDELMSRPFIEFVHPDDRERTLAQNRAVRAGEQALSFENRYVCKDGSYRWLRWNAASQTSRQMIYSVARDITEHRRAEEERDAATRELVAALAEVRSLRAILPICSYCHRIRDDANDWETVETYIAKHTHSRFSHGICPTCYIREIEPQLGPMSKP